MYDSETFLKQEEEFLKLNDEINMKTKNLLDEAKILKEVSFNNDVNDVYKNYKETDSDYLNNMNDIDTQNITSRKQFNLDDYISKTNLEENKSEILNSTSRPNEKEIEKIYFKDFPNKQNYSLSARNSVTLISTTDLGEQTIFPLSITGRKSDKFPYDKIDKNLIPDSVKGIGHEGMVRFLTAKVKSLGNEIQSFQKEDKKNQEKIKELQIQKDKAFEDKERLMQQVNTAKNSVIKCEQHSKDLSIQLQTFQTENSHLKKELEIVKKEMRNNKQNSSANEIKLNRTLEEVERLKTIIQQMKQDEKDFKELSRKKTEDLTNSVKKLDKQRLELLNGFKKQLLLIDNLKKQKGLNEAAKLLQSSEGDFFNFLNSNFPNILTENNSETVNKVNLKP